MKKVSSLDLTPISKKAFTTIELIFVIVIIAIISSVGVGFIPNYDLLNDTNYILMQIKQKQNRALSYDTTWQNAVDYNLTCVEFTTPSLEALDAKKTYKIRSEINPNKILCFDFLGRPYEYNDSSPREVQLLLTNFEINVSKSSKTKTISVYPMSGYAKIK